jgi:glycosyl transferase family 25
MARLSEGFGLVRVINLRERRDRLREVTAQLAAVGVGFERGKVELYEATRPSDPGGFDSLGARGCYTSHLEILRDARDRGVESVLVMEDDCEILPRHVERLEALVDELQGRAWGFAYLGHIVPMAGASTNGWQEYGGPVQTTHLYAVHRSSLPGIVGYLEACLTRPGGHPVGGPMPVDGALTMYRAAHPEVVTLMAQPVVAGQWSSRSDITAKWWDQVPGVGSAIGVARGMKRRLRS